jgi:predicted DNA-binding protein (UPF0278 family)
MSEHSIVVSDEELGVIKTYRKKKAREAFESGFKTDVIKLALEFDQWLIANDRGMSFSTFIDEFGYQGPYAKQFYKNIEMINSAIIAPVEGEPLR